MNRLCPNAITCVGVDSPVLNISAEAPDGLIWASPIPVPNPPPIPCLGCDPRDIYRTRDCYGVAFSAESQEEADLLARLSGAICKQPISQQYTNDPQTATATCASGSVFSYTVPAGMITIAADPDPTAWIAASNAAALAYAEQQASSLAQRCCLNTTNLSPHPGWICLGQELADDIINQYTITGLNSEGTWNFNIIGGTLPPGTFLISVSNNTAQLVGIPTVPGIYNYTIQATRPAVPFVSVSVTDTLSVFGISNPDLPDGTTGTAYSEQLLTAGGTLPVNFSADPLDLPDGLTMDSAGLITGTPTTAGVTGFDVTITDAEGGVCTQTVTITVAAGGLDWSTLVWGPLYNIHNPTLQPPYSDPTGAFGGASIILVTANGGGHPLGDWISAASCDGTLTYNGPALNGTISLSAIFGGDPVQASVKITIFQDAVFVNDALIRSFTADPNPASVPFTIADTLGLPSIITVTVQWHGGTAGGGDGSVSASGSIS